MGGIGWRKVENEHGYPCYVEENTGNQSMDHPEFCKIIECLKNYNNIKYSNYRIAFKIYSLQQKLLVPPLRITTGVFARHQLSLSESSLSLDVGELEAVLADIYFAAEKEGLFSGDVDLTIDLVINLLLNVYDRDRKEPIRVLAAKTLLAILSNDSCTEKWQALANYAADHNGCVSPRRLAGLLTSMVALPEYLGERDGVRLQEDVDSCFSTSAGMLGVGARALSEWGGGCGSARWLPALGRLARARAAGGEARCSLCKRTAEKMLQFKCAKCVEVYLCEVCHLCDEDASAVAGHKRSHVVHEIINGELKPPECLSFIRNVRRFFSCTRKKKKDKINAKMLAAAAVEPEAAAKAGKPAIFTSTVGKASGHGAGNPASVLQDVIAQLESQNKALKDLSNQLQAVNKETDGGLRVKVDTHWSHISTQITRLKILKENLSQTTPSPAETKPHPERLQAFDMFSPIPLEEQKTKTDNLTTQPRVLSLDSGNFSVISKQTAGDPRRDQPTSDTISTVSMNDISSWYNDQEQSPPSAQPAAPSNPEFSHSFRASEQKFDADLRSVASSNDKMRELNADLDTVLDRLQRILVNNFDESCFDNTQLRETANEMEDLLGSLIRGVEQRATLSRAAV